MNTGHPYRRWLCLAAPLPALAVGVLVMRHAGLPASVWGQNLAAGLVLTTVCAFLPAATRPRPVTLWRAVTCGALGVLLTTFFDRGLAGVHRWVPVGPLRIHAGAVCLPALILALGAEFRQPGAGRREWLVALIGVGTLGVLVLQPDAAQATGFAGALILLLFLGRARISVFAEAVPLAAAGVAWGIPDPLTPVRHVEGIVGLAAQNGALWRAVALLALALLPLPFMLDWRGGDFPTALALGIYFALCLLAPLFGAFPVPIIGFGLSPIIGYFLALGWLVTREDRNAN